MNYSEDFKNLIEKSEADNTFIGAGNPNGKILFIGKECAIGEDKNPEKQIIQDRLYHSEVTLHICKWCKNIWEDISQEEVEEARCIEDYNPLFPYKGKKVLRFIEGKNNGIASTWYYYQKLYDAILGSPDRSNRSTLVDFFEDCFMTELSHITAKKSSEADSTERNQSIVNRVKLFKEDPFFQSFPIVIVAAGEYLNRSDVNITDIFSVDDISAKYKTDEIYNRYPTHLKGIYKINSVENPKLVIAMCQPTAHGVTSEFIQLLGDLCRDFIKENKIQLNN